MDYNTRKERLILPEYGRNIQMMVNFALTVEDKEQRNRVVRSIIAVMGNMNPHLRDINDFKHKLWDHLAIMSDFKLDIDSPYSPPSKEVLEERPNNIPYNKEEIRYRHFGRIMQKLIRKATEHEDGQEKDKLVEVIANHMKKSYLMWNKEVVSDDLIINALSELSDGKIQTESDLKLTQSKEILARGKRKRIGKK